MKRFTLLSVGLFAATAVAQDKVQIQVTDGAKPVRYTIETQAKSTTEREVLVDGEPAGNAGGGGRGGFGGGGGTTTTSQTVVFDEGSEDGATWRVYRKAHAKVERPGRDGEMQESEIEGGGLDEKLFIVEDDRGTVVMRGSVDGEEMPPMMARGMPTRTSFAGILPSEPVAVGAEFDLPAGFVAAMNGLVHPVRPAVDPEAIGGRGGRGGRGGQQGDAPQGGDPQQGGRGQGGRGQGARGQGGRGQAGGGFAGRGMMGAPTDMSFTLLANDKLGGKLVGKVVEVTDGVAKIDFKGVREGKGALADLGLNAGGFGGGRGGRAGGGAAPEGEGSAKLDLAGSIWVDTTRHALVRFVVEGTSNSKSHMVMNMRDREMEVSTGSDGTFRVAVSAADVPAEKKD